MQLAEFRVSATLTLTPAETKVEYPNPLFLITPPVLTR